MTLSMEEVERRLRRGLLCHSDNLECADAIKSHRERCVDVGPLAALVSRWNTYIGACDKSDTGALARAGYHTCAYQLSALLPPQKSALQRAVMMAEMMFHAGPCESIVFRGNGEALLALLREAEKETGR